MRQQEPACYAKRRMSLDTNNLTITLFLAFIFILLLRKGFHKIAFIVSLIFAILLGFYDLMYERDGFFLITMASALFFYYDVIYGLILLRQAYAEGKIGRRMKRK